MLVSLSLNSFVSGSQVGDCDFFSAVADSISQIGWTSLRREDFRVVFFALGYDWT